MQMAKLSLICAMDQNRLIGKDNTLPWHLPADLAFFKRTTIGKPILMGRKTFQSIGRPLPGRQNIIITRDKSFNAEGCDVVNTIDQALKLCVQQEDIMLIGGASLYEQTITQADYLYVTEIHHQFEGDTWFPALHSEDWLIDLQEDFKADEKNNYAYSFIKYSRELSPNLR